MEHGSEARGFLDKGSVLEQKLSMLDALEAYRDGVDRLGDNQFSLRVELYYKIGSLLTRLGEYERAREAFLSMDDHLDELGLEYFYGNRSFYRGIIHLRRKEIKSAQIELKKCLSILPDHNKAALLKSYIHAERSADLIIKDGLPKFIASLSTTVYDLLPDVESVRTQKLPDVEDEYFYEVWERLKPYTVITIERFYNIYSSCKYIADKGIEGDFIECGVYLGGSILAAAMFSRYFGITDRKFYVLDTFSGFAEDTSDIDYEGRKVVFNSVSHSFDIHFKNIVEKNIKDNGLDSDNFIFVEGYVEETLPGLTFHNDLAYIRLDTDYYKSTYVELECLWPILNIHGVLILDDYGHFQGAREATDTFFKKNNINVLLQRIDYSGRCAVKSEECNDINNG